MDYLSYCRPAARNFVFGGDRGRGGGGEVARTDTIACLTLKHFRAGEGRGEGGQH